MGGIWKTSDGITKKRDFERNFGANLNGEEN